MNLSQSVRSKALKGRFGEYTIFASRDCHDLVQNKYTYVYLVMTVLWNSEIIFRTKLRHNCPDMVFNSFKKEDLILFNPSLTFLSQKQRSPRFYRILMYSGQYVKVRQYSFIHSTNYIILKQVFSTVIHKYLFSSEQAIKERKYIGQPFCLKKKRKLHTTPGQRLGNCSASFSAIKNRNKNVIVSKTSCKGEAGNRTQSFFTFGISHSTQKGSEQPSTNYKLSTACPQFLDTIS